MPSPDLIVRRIGLPATVVGRCPTRVLVEVLNDGADVAVGPFDVLLEIESGVEEQAVFQDSQTVGAEEQRLDPGEAISIDFGSVRFPCAPAKPFVSATADWTHRIPGNARTNPTLTVGPVTRIQSVPWLFTKIGRIGLEDSSGAVTWDPPRLCDGGTLVVEGEVRNDGCDDAPVSVTELRLLDGVGQTLTTRSGTTGFGTPAGGSSPFLFTLPLPRLPAGSAVTVQVCADVNASVSPQCDRLRLCDAMSMLIHSAAGAPAPRLTVHGKVVPAQRPVISWDIANSCSDLVLVTARILFKGTEIYKSPPIYVGFQSSAGETNKTLPALPPAALSDDFFTVGLKQVELVVEATGRDKGPFRTHTTFEVIPESIDPGWWTWVAPARGSQFAWKGPYTLIGRLTNQGRARMTPTSVTYREHDKRAAGRGSDVLRVASFASTSLAAGAAANATVAGIAQTWEWVSSLTWAISDVLDKTLEYTTEVDIQDEFGNIYNASFGDILSVTVVVSATKKTNADLAASALYSAVGMFTAAVAALAFPPAAAALFGIAFGLFGAARAFGASALDPPRPDFRYRERVTLQPPLVPEVLRDVPPNLRAVRSLLELAGRIAAAQQALSPIESKLLGAYADADTEAAALQEQDYREAKDALARAVALIPNTVGEAVEGIEAEEHVSTERIDEGFERLRREGVPAEARALWAELQLPEDALEALTSMTRELADPPEPPSRLLEQLSTALVTLGQEIQSQTPALPGHEPR